MAGSMLRGRWRITVGSPYLERLKAFAGGRRRGVFGVTADAVNALLARHSLVGSLSLEGKVT